MQAIKPGEWRVTLGELPAANILEHSEPTIEYPEVLVQKVFPEFKKKFALPNPPQIFYPCCGFDASPSVFFKDCIYIDKDQRPINALRKEGLSAYQANALAYDPQRRIDLLILFNPQLGRDETLDLVKRIGPQFILCNNYHKTADNLRGDANFKLLGRIEKLYEVFSSSG